jgi:hypothetical protein
VDHCDRARSYRAVRSGNRIIVGSPHDRAFLVPLAAIGAVGFLLHNVAEIRHLAAKPSAQK